MMQKVFSIKFLLTNKFMSISSVQKCDIRTEQISLLKTSGPQSNNAVRSNSLTGVNAPEITTGDYVLWMESPSQNPHQDPPTDTTS